jgi:hypothetical protein
MAIAKKKPAPTTAARTPKTTQKAVEDPPNWPMRVAWAVVALLVVVQINAFIQKHKTVAQPPAVVPVEINPYTARVAAAFTPGLESEALEYAAYFEALQNVVETDRLMVPTGVVMKVQEVRNLPELAALDTVVEAAMGTHTSLPESGALTSEQVAALATTWKQLRDACLAASRD